MMKKIENLFFSPFFHFWVNFLYDKKCVNLKIWTVFQKKKIHLKFHWKKTVWLSGPSSNFTEHHQIIDTTANIDTSRSSEYSYSRSS